MHGFKEKKIRDGLKKIFSEKKSSLFFNSFKED
jgi:hypothetical protein